MQTCEVQHTVSCPFPRLFLLPYYKEEEERVSHMGTIAAELINHSSDHLLPSAHSIPPRYAVHLQQLLVDHRVLLIKGRFKEIKDVLVLQFCATIKCTPFLC